MRPAGSWPEVGTGHPRARPIRSYRQSAAPCVPLARCAWLRYPARHPRRDSDRNAIVRDAFCNGAPVADDLTIPDDRSTQTDRAPGQPEVIDGSRHVRTLAGAHVGNRMPVICANLIVARNHDIVADDNCRSFGRGHGDRFRGGHVVADERAGILPDPDVAGARGNALSRSQLHVPVVAVEVDDQSTHPRFIGDDEPVVRSGERNPDVLFDHPP